MLLLLELSVANVASVVVVVVVAACVGCEQHYFAIVVAVVINPSLQLLLLFLSLSASFVLS